MLGTAIEWAPGSTIQARQGVSLVERTFNSSHVQRKLSFSVFIPRLPDSWTNLDRRLLGKRS